MGDYYTMEIGGSEAKERSYFTATHGNTTDKTVNQECPGFQP